MNSIRAIQKLNERELEAGIGASASWHNDYRDTAYIYIGGLPFEISEGDIITLFSQFGEPVWIKLARDKETGKSRGFAWLKYEDQRSTDLAVDNLSGTEIMGRVLRVDHTRYKPGKDEDMRDNTMGEVGGKNESKRVGMGSGTESESEEERAPLPEEIELATLERELDEDDPMKPEMLKRVQQKIDVALAKLEKKRRKEKERERKHRSRRHHRDRSRSRDRERRRIRDDSYSRSRSRSASPRNRRHGSSRRARRSTESESPPPKHRRRERRSTESESPPREHRRKEGRSGSPWDRD